MGGAMMWWVSMWAQRRLGSRIRATCVRATRAGRGLSQRGQATTEYALVLLGVAAVAMALTTWAAGGKIGSFLDAVFERLVTTAK